MQTSNDRQRRSKKHHLSEFNVPGLLWVLLLMGIMYFAPSFLPDVYVPYLPFVVGLLFVLINFFFPYHPRVKEMRALAEVLLNGRRGGAHQTTVVINTTNEAGETTTETYVTDEHIEVAAKGSPLGNILWG